MTQHSKFEFPEIRVVEASAGSGKTYALAKRYVQLILSPDACSDAVAVRNVLAITFTNKASHEMKRRILSFLKDIALDRMSEENWCEIVKPTGLTHVTAKQRAFVVMDDIIRHYNFFQVQTIDKFINSLLAGCAIKLELTGNFRIKTSSNEYLMLALDDLIDQATDDSNLMMVFERFLHNYIYIEGRSGWLPKKDILESVFSIYAQYNNFAREFIPSKYSHEDISHRRRLIYENIKRLRENMPENTNKTFLKSIDAFIANNDKGYDFDAFKDTFLKFEIPVNKGAQASESAVHLWDEIRADIHDLAYVESHSLFNPYIEIFSKIYELAESKARKEDVMFLSELNRKAQQLFANDQIPVQELYYRLAMRFQHYLIDEFQDTSRLQWGNIMRMVEEALSTGGSLFYVGDRKQSIYSFRGGDALLFDEIQKQWSNYNVKNEQLRINYRSAPAVVEFNNEIFTWENIEQFLDNEEFQSKKDHKNITFTGEELAYVKNIFSSSQQQCKRKNIPGYVYLHMIDGKNKDTRNETMREMLMKTLKDVRKRYKDGQIALLTRSNTEVEELTSWLSEENIPVDSERTTNVLENSFIREILSFLRFLDSPVDNLSFAEFLVSDIFCQASEKNADHWHAFLLSVRPCLNTQKDFYIYTAFRDEYPELWKKCVEPFFKNIGMYPLYELVVSILARFECMQRFASAQGYFMHFLNLVKEAEEENADLKSFLEFLETVEKNKLFIDAGNHNAVKILTIHKSKGLEFPVVIIPFLGMSVQAGSKSATNQSFILKESEFDNHDVVQMVRSKDAYIKYNEEVQNLYENEYKTALVNELNNVYVALTRAKDELYAFVPEKTGNTKNFARFLLPSEKKEWGQKSSNNSDVENKNVNVILKPEYRHDWIDYLRDEFFTNDSLKRRNERRRGEMIHALLAQVKDISLLDWGNFSDSLKLVLQNEFPNAENSDEVFVDVKKIINEEKFVGFFKVNDAKIFTEYEIVDEKGLTLRLDRLLVWENEIWIVDFKTTQDKRPEYTIQINDYRRCVNAIYPQKSIRCFLVYTDLLIVDEVMYAS